MEKKNWVQNTLNDQKLGNYLEVSNRTQPTPNPIRDRSGRPVVRDDTRIVQDGRNTSRSQEINVNSFYEEPSSFERTGRFVETNVIQTRSSEDRKDSNVEKGK